MSDGAAVHELPGAVGHGPARPAMRLAGHTFLGTYAHRAHGWLCHLWHTGYAHGARLTEAMGLEVGESAIRLLVTAGWVERQAFEPAQGARAMAGLTGQSTSAWASEDDYGYAPVRDSALRWVVLGCIHPEPYRCRVGVTRAWSVPGEGCDTEPAPVAYGPTCSTLSGMYHRIMRRHLHTGRVLRLAGRVQRVCASWRERHAAYLRRCESAEAAWSEIEPPTPTRPRGGGRRRAAAMAG